MSYHKFKIHKHSYKSPFKIQEEFFEYIDALSTNNKIMAAQELSDIYGCVENEAAKIGLTVNDLKIMSDLTKDVFIKRHRVNDNLLSYLKNSCDNIYEYGLGFVPTIRNILAVFYCQGEAFLRLLDEVHKKDLRNLDFLKCLEPHFQPQHCRYSKDNHFVC